MNRGQQMTTQETKNTLTHKQHQTHKKIRVTRVKNSKWMSSFCLLQEICESIT